MVENLVLQESVRRLVGAYQPERAYLFGSEPRGKDDAESDFDLMVVVPDEALAERRCSRIAYQVLGGTRTAADVLVWTRQVFDERLHLEASLPYTIANEGKLLYGA